MVAYIGIWNTLADIWLGLINWLYVDVSPKKSVVATDPKLALDWRAVLYHGNAKERVPLRALHSITGSLQTSMKMQRVAVTNIASVKGQRLPDADVSSLVTMKMRVSAEVREAGRQQIGDSQHHE